MDKYICERNLILALAYEGGGNGLVMPVAPMYGGGGGFGNNGFGGDWAWIILLLVLCGGWGNGFGGGFGGGFNNDLYPWMNQSNQINGGFRDQMIHDTITGIGDKVVSGFGDVATQLCGGFAGVNAAITNAQMANMQSTFGLQSALQNCCCENRESIADLKYTLATEACATRSAHTQNTQAILDKLCQLELDGYKREVDSLRGQLTDAKFAASQTAQTAQIRAAQVQEIDAIYNRLVNCPIPSEPVFGKQAIFTCQNNNNCGCGCGG